MAFSALSVLGAAVCIMHTFNDTPAIAVSGRVQNKPTLRAIAFDFQGVWINTTVSGAANVSVVLQTECPREWDVMSQFRCFVNDTFWGYIDTATLPCGEKVDALVASQLSGDVHRIGVVKITEPAFNRDSANKTNAIASFGFRVCGSNPRVLPTKTYTTKRIEFLGDSLTAGYCNMCDQHPGENNSYRIEDFWRSWPSIVCRRQNAECHTEAWSGRGVIRNYDYLTTHTTMPTIYQRTLGTDNTTAWDFSQWIPDVLVINLGTNDYTHPTDAAFTREFVAAYIQLINATLRAYHHRPRLLITCGPPPVSCEAVGDVRRAAASFYAVTSVDFVGLDEGEQCCGHPNALSDERIAEKLLPSL